MTLAKSILPIDWDSLVPRNDVMEICVRACKALRQAQGDALGAV